jgi:hypothetical protein
MGKRDTRIASKLSFRMRSRDLMEENMMTRLLVIISIGMFVAAIAVTSIAAGPHCHGPC